MRLCFDLETNGLLDTVSTIHCVNTLDVDSGEARRYHDDESITPRAGSMREGLEYLCKATDLIGQNIIKYDLPVIEKLHPRLYPNQAQVFDTKVASSLIWTNLYENDIRALRKGRLPPEFQKKGLCGSHSLRAWGYRLGVLKGDAGNEGNDWSTFTQQMSDYCEQDNVVTKAFYEYILGKNYAEEALSLEHEVARIISRQERRGFAFDVESAEKLHAHLLMRKVELEDKLRHIFEPWEVVDKVFTPKRDNKKLGYTAGVTVTKYKTVMFNPGSRDQIADRLMKLRGWEPEEFTDSGKPKVDETILAALPYPEAKQIAEYLMVDKRLGQIGEGNEAWLKAVRNGRIHGTVNTCGAVTGRMTHSRPNVAQVPRVGTPFGKECRSLFVASPGYLLVGCDAEGLELRVLAHYMARYDGGEYVEVVVNGKKEDGTDVHTVNQRAIGLHKRDSSKTFIYALIYGAGDYKLGTIVYEDFDAETKARFDAVHNTKAKRQRALAKLGKSRRARLMENLPALGKLTEAVKAAAKRGFLKGLDGRHLHVRSEHAALNTLLQSGGAVVMKKALVLLDQQRVVRALDFEFVANIHDEFQAEVIDDGVQPSLVGTLAASAIQAAGEAYNLRCPLAGSFEIGRNWAETH